MSPTLDTPEALQQTDFALRRVGVSVENEAWTLIHSVGDDESTLGPITALKKKAGLDGDEVERLLLWHCARLSQPDVASLPVERSVRERLDQLMSQLHTMKVPMTAGSQHFHRAAKLSTLRRFPAGPMEWEVSGIPKSWLLKASFPENLRFLWFVTLRLCGWAPCFFMHVAPAPLNRALSVPKQVLRSYYRMARSLQSQPSMRALVAYAWFHDPAAVRDHPHLEVLNEPYVKEDGLIVSMEPAPPSSGVLEGNDRRRADYMAGKVQYRYGLAIWPRDAAIRWADAHPELAESAETIRES
jgi:hypothetical protein